MVRQINCGSQKIDFMVVQRLDMTSICPKGEEGRAGCSLSMRPQDSVWGIACYRITTTAGTERIRYGQKRWRTAADISTGRIRGGGRVCYGSSEGKING